MKLINTHVIKKNQIKLNILKHGKNKNVINFTHSNLKDPEKKIKIFNDLI